MVARPGRAWKPAGVIGGLVLPWGRVASDRGTDVEESLLAGLRSAPPAALETLVRLYGPRLLGVARRFLGNEDDAQTAVQEVFLSAFESPGRFEDGARLGTWLHRSVVDAVLRRLRARPSRPETPIEELLPRFLEDGHHTAHPADWSERGEALLDRPEVREFVRGCIERLPESYRSVLLLRDIEELAVDETARALGIGESLVSLRLHRARQALRALLEPQLGQGAA